MLKRVGLFAILLIGSSLAAPLPPISEGGVGVPLFSRRLSTNSLYAIESIKAGMNHLYLDGLDVRVYGKLTVSQFLNVSMALAHMPKHLRVYADDICVNHDIGKLTQDGKVIAIVVGYGGEGRIIIERDVLNSLKSAKDVLYHEAGHNYDRANGNPSLVEPWGTGESVTTYGSTCNRDDFAETFSDVLSNYNKYKERSSADWLKDPLAHKKQIIMKIMESK